MADYNVQMQYFNGSSYDSLYPSTYLNNITNWNNSIYSKGEVDGKINSINSNISSINSQISSLTSSVNSSLKKIHLTTITIRNVEFQYFSFQKTEEDVIGVYRFNFTNTENPESDYGIRIVRHNEDYAHGGTQLCMLNSGYGIYINVGICNNPDGLDPWGGDLKITSYRTMFTGTLEIYVYRFT